MAWVRYDDSFDTNPKVTAVIIDDPGAISLHTLANTWSNKQKHPGFVPAHQPGVLLCNKDLGSVWAAVLVRHGLWHERGKECTACAEEYAHLPEDAVGYVFHNAREYRAPARDRTTPGTPADLSEKRREAGRRGGQASAARRSKTKQNQANQASVEASQANEANGSGRGADVASGSVLPFIGEVAATAISPRPAETQQTARANEANGASKSSKLLFAGVSPEPVPVNTCASNEAQDPPSAGATKSRRASSAKPADRQINENAGTVVGAYVDAAVAAGHPRPGESLRARVGKQARRLLSENHPFDRVLTAAQEMARSGWNDLEVQMQRSSAANNGRSGSPGGRHRPYTNPEDPSSAYTGDL